MVLTYFPPPPSALALRVDLDVGEAPSDKDMIRFLSKVRGTSILGEMFIPMNTTNAFPFNCA